MAYEKHRDEKQVYDMDFVKRLAEGETISNPTVKVAQRSGKSLWTDRTAEFLGTPAPAVTGSKVQFVLKQAAAGEQLSSREYDVYVKADTSQGRIIVSTAELAVTSVAS